MKIDHNFLESISEGSFCSIKEIFLDMYIKVPPPDSSVGLCSLLYPELSL